MRFVDLALIVFVALAFVISGLIAILRERGISLKSIVKRFAGGCLILGAIGFLAPDVFKTAGFEVSQNFEWPIGHSNSALQFSDGSYAVPHIFSGRVQIYNSNREFLRGWRIPTRGRFKILPTENNNFEVFVRNLKDRYKYKYTYSLSGQLLSEELYTGAYPSDSPYVVSISIPTPWYGWLFTSPIKGWLFAAIGILLLNLSTPRPKNIIGGDGSWS